MDGNVALVWTAAHATIRHMYLPAVLTLVEGLNAANVSVSVQHDTRNMTEEVSKLVAGDLFIWVGVWSLPDTGKPLLHRLTSQGVYTVFYSTEANFACPCKKKEDLNTREVWEYSMSNLLCCKPTANIPWRYIPPGYHPPSQLARSSPQEAERLIFLGSTSKWYDKRRACLRQVALMLMQPSSIIDNSTCAKSMCGPACGCDATRTMAGPFLHACGTPGCSLGFLSTQKEGEIGNVIAQNSAFVNLHKACNISATSSKSACESFRFAVLLSSGVQVFSEHCHEADEQVYAGLVQFLPVPHIGKAVRDFWGDSQRHGHARSAAEYARTKSAAFAQRFGAATIFERAGVMPILRAGRNARRLLNFTLAARPASTTRSTLEASDAHCFPEVK